MVANMNSKGVLPFISQNNSRVKPLVNPVVNFGDARFASVLLQGIVSKKKVILA